MLSQYLFFYVKFSYWWLIDWFLFFNRKYMKKMTIIKLLNLNLCQKIMAVSSEIEIIHNFTLYPTVCQKIFMHHIIFYKYRMFGLFWVAIIIPSHHTSNWNKFYFLYYKFGRCRQNKHSTTWTIRKTLKIPTPSPFIPSPTSTKSTVGSKLIAKNSKFSWTPTLSLKPESKSTSPPLKTKGVPSCFSSINLV